MKYKKTLLWVFISIIACILTIFPLFRYRFPIAKYFGSYLEKRDPLKKSDIIFAPSSRLETNFTYAVTLLKEGWGNGLIITTSKMPPLRMAFYQRYGLDLTEKRITQRVFIKEELSLDKLTILEDSISSFTDCRLLFDFWKENPFDSLILVTDSPHSRRFSITLKKIFDGSGVSITCYPSFPERSLDDLFSDPDDFVMYVFTEYIKMLAYAIKYSF